jgi:hypothetical protein
MAHSRDVVARIKGALQAGLGPKLLSNWTGVPADTIKRWHTEEKRANVPADESVGDELRDAVMGRFLGRESTR